MSPSEVDFLRRYSNQGPLARLLEQTWQHVLTCTKGLDEARPRRQAHRLARRLSVEQVEALLAEHVAGRPWKHIAQDQGLSEYAVGVVLRSCGVEPDSQDLTVSEIALATERYLSGWSIKHCAQELGRAYSSVHGALVRSGIELRPARKPLSFTDAQVAVLSQRYLAGETMKVIAADVGVSPETVRRALRRHGVELRPAVRFSDASTKSPFAPCDGSSIRRDA